MRTRGWLATVIAAALAASELSAVAAPAPADATAQAEAAVAGAEQAIAPLASRQAELSKRYATQTAAIDAIKQQKPSWRRDRELRSALADAADTANQLAAVTRDVAAANARVADARKAAVAAIDAELAAGAAGPRAQQLASERARWQPASSARKIVLPNSDLDPLADPEDLDQQAAALRAAEGELQHQVDDLGARAAMLQQSADARKAHDRATDLAVRDDDEPHRGGAHTVPGGHDIPGTSSTISGPTQPAQGVANNGVPVTQPATITVASDSDTAVILADVVDASTLDSLARAQRSGDPAQRAAAAKRARDAVAARLVELRARRVAIENRARELRTK